MNLKTVRKYIIIIIIIHYDKSHYEIVYPRAAQNGLKFLRALKYKFFPPQSVTICKTHVIFCGQCSPELELTKTEEPLFKPVCRGCNVNDKRIRVIKKCASGKNSWYMRVSNLSLLPF